MGIWDDDFHHITVMEETAERPSLFLDRFGNPYVMKTIKQPIGFDLRKKDKKEGGSTG